MIENESQYKQSLTVLNRVENALAALRKRIEPVNPELFQAMAQSYIDEITEIRYEIDEYIGINSATEAKAPLWFSLVGESLKSSEISSKLLSDWLSKFRHAIQNVAEFIDTNRPLTGRPSARIVTYSDPKLVAIKPGSIKIGLKFPDMFIQGELFSENSNSEFSLPHKAVNRLLELVAWIDSSEQEFPSSQFSDETEIIILANQILSLVPSSRSIVKTLRFSGALVPSSTTLTINVESRPKVQSIIDMLTTIYEDSVEGVIREIDLDAQRIILRERGPASPDLKCFLPDELVTLAESLLNKFVRVRGKISSASPDIVNAISIEELNVP